MWCLYMNWYRFLDIAITTIFLPVLIPIFIVVYIFVYFDMHGNVFFTQERVGLGQKKFVIYKFKTMHSFVDENNELLPDELRVSALGKILRKLSLDELPELAHIYRNEMSLVGPRPLIEEQVLQMENPLKRQSVLPGLTGWAQVNGRNAVSIIDKYKYDTWYIENRNVLLYLKILFIHTPMTLLHLKNADSMNFQKSRNDKA